MQLQTARRIDFYCGIPICFFLTLLRRLGRLLGLAGRPLPPIRRILFIKLAEQGATVLAYTAIRRAAELVGPENVFFLVFEKNRSILDLLDVPPRENVLLIRDERLSAFVFDVLKTLWRTRRLGIDTTIDMELLARVTAVLAFLTGAHRRVGLHKFANEGLYRGDLLTHRVIYNPHHHIATHYDVLLAAAQRDPDEIPLAKYVPNPEQHLLPRYRISDEERGRLSGLLAESGVDMERMRLVIFNAKFDDIMPIRRWPPECFADLGRRLLKRFPDAAVVISGMADEREDAEKLRRAIGEQRVANIAGKISLLDLIALLSVSDVLVTSDSGPAHFAALTDVDIVVMFGCETPDLYGPLGEHAYPVYKKLACSPCLSAANHRLSFCRDNQCMKLITVDDIFDLTAKILESRPPRIATAAGDSPAAVS